MKKPTKKDSLKDSFEILKDSLEILKKDFEMDGEILLYKGKPLTDRYSKDFERDGEILLYKGKPFTGRYPNYSDSWWDLVWDGRPTQYYKDGKVIFAFGMYTYITPELTEEEIDKAMKEIDKNWTGLKNWFFPITKQAKKLKEAYEIFKKSKLKK